MRWKTEALKGSQAEPLTDEQIEALWMGDLSLAAGRTEYHSLILPLIGALARAREVDSDERGVRTPIAEALVATEESLAMHRKDAWYHAVVTSVQQAELRGENPLPIIRTAMVKMAEEFIRLRELEILRIMRGGSYNG